MHARAWLLLGFLILAAGCADEPCAGGLTAQPTPGGIALAWSPVGNATTYVVLRGVDGADPLPYAEVDGTQHTFLDGNVTTGHRYTYTVATAEGAPTDGCSTVDAAVADASVPFFEGPALTLAAAGGLLGALLVFGRRR